MFGMESFHLDAVSTPSPNLPRRVYVCRLGRLNPQQMVMCVRALGRLDVKTM